MLFGKYLEWYELDFNTTCMKNFAKKDPKFMLRASCFMIMNTGLLNLM